jgi:hypothetical protein
LSRLIHDEQPHIRAYQYENLSYATDDNGNPIVVNGVQQTVPNPQVGGTAGPAGDNYLYSHFQFDTQASYRLPWDSRCTVTAST